ncbi:hypothetical protein NBRC116602_05350 [Hyphomicrobiales bacterium 4NK60-0047b]|jgi:hypothetical protein
MSSPKGHIPTEKLDDLLHSVMEWADHAQIDGEPLQHSEESNNPNQKTSNNAPSGKAMQKKKPFFSNFGNIVTTLVSAIALIFSGYSFYETVLKEAQLKIYAPALVHMYRKDFRDVLAIPLTISNDGAKRGTILSIDLKVTNIDTGENKTFENLYFGNNPKDTSRIFTPLTMSGRSSKSEVIMFFADRAGAFFKTTGGVKSNLKFDLKINTDNTEYLFKPKQQPTLSFNMTATFIQSFRSMESGVPTVYYKSKAAKAKKSDQEKKSPEIKKPVPEKIEEKPKDIKTNE